MVDRVLTMCFSESKQERSSTSGVDVDEKIVDLLDRSVTYVFEVRDGNKKPSLVAITVCLFFGAFGLQCIRKIHHQW